MISNKHHSRRNRHTPQHHPTQQYPRPHMVSKDQIEARMKYPTPGDSMVYSGVGKKHFWTSNIKGKYGIQQEGIPIILYKPRSDYRSLVHLQESVFSLYLIRNKKNYDSPPQITSATPKNKLNFSVKKVLELNINPEDVTIEPTRPASRTRKVMIEQPKIRAKTELNNDLIQPYPVTEGDYSHLTRRLPRIKTLDADRLPVIEYPSRQMRREMRKLSPTFKSSEQNPLNHNVCKYVFFG